MCIIVTDPELIVKRGERLHASKRHDLPGTKPCSLFCGGNAIPKSTSIV